MAIIKQDFIKESMINAMIYFVRSKLETDLVNVISAVKLIFIAG